MWIQSLNHSLTDASEVFLTLTLWWKWRNKELDFTKLSYRCTECCVSLKYISLSLKCSSLRQKCHINSWDIEQVWRLNAIKGSPYVYGTVLDIQKKLPVLAYNLLMRQLKTEPWLWGSSGKFHAKVQREVLSVPGGLCVNTRNKSSGENIWYEDAWRQTNYLPEGEQPVTCSYCWILNPETHILKKG